MDRLRPISHEAALQFNQLRLACDQQTTEGFVKVSQEERERQWALERQRAERDAASLAADARDA